MAGYDVNVGKELLPGLLNGRDGLAKLVEAVLNQILEAQLTEAWGLIGTSVRKNALAISTATARARCLPASGRSRCKCRRRGTAASPATSSSVTSTANRLSCWR